MVLLVATFFPPVIVALLNRGVFAGAKAYSPKTCPDTEGGLGGWRPYTPKYCADGVDNTQVDNSFWHAFDILLVIKISLVAAILWTIAYYKGEDAKDGFPPSDDNQRVCKILKVESDTATELTYSIEQDFLADSHAEGECGFKNSVEYYAHFIPPSLMVLVGMGLPLPNLTIVTTVSSFVIDMELIGIVLGTIESAGQMTITEVEGTSCFETACEINISTSTGECERFIRRFPIRLSDCDRACGLNLSIGIDSSFKFDSLTFA